MYSLCLINIDYQVCIMYLDVAVRLILSIPKDRSIAQYLQPGGRGGAFMLSRALNKQETDSLSGVPPSPRPQAKPFLQWCGKNVMGDQMLEVVCLCYCGGSRTGAPSRTGGMVNGQEIKKASNKSVRPPLSPRSRPGWLPLAWFSFVQHYHSSLDLFFTFWVVDIFWEIIQTGNSFRKKNHFHPPVAERSTWLQESENYLLLLLHGCCGREEARHSFNVCMSTAVCVLSACRHPASSTPSVRADSPSLSIEKYNKLKLCGHNTPNTQRYYEYVASRQCSAMLSSCWTRQALLLHTPATQQTRWRRGKWNTWHRRTWKKHGKEKENEKIRHLNTRYIIRTKKHNQRSK